MNTITLILKNFSWRFTDDFRAVFSVAVKDKVQSMSNTALGYGSLKTHSGALLTTCLSPQHPARPTNKAPVKGTAPHK